MIKFFKDSSTLSMTSKLTLIYILNVLDIIFTLSLIKTGLFMEANALMVPVVSSSLLSIFIKILLPAFLMIYIIINLHDMPNTYLPVSNFFINLVFVVYSGILIMHLYYLSFYLLDVSA